jgi:hypothetical protein
LEESRRGCPADCLPNIRNWLAPGHFNLSFDSIGISSVDEILTRISAPEKANVVVYQPETGFMLLSP